MYVYYAVHEGIRVLGLVGLGGFKSRFKRGSCREPAKASRERRVLGAGLLSNQGEKSINFFSITVPLRKKY